MMALSPAQRETLSSFQAVTEETNEETAIAALERSNWNLEAAVQQVFQEKEDSEIATALSESSAPTRSDTPADGEPLGQVPEPVQPRSPTAARPTPPMRRGGFLALFTWPFGLAWNFTWAFLNFALRLFTRRSLTSGITSNARSSATRRTEDPVSNAHRFKAAFERKYGEDHPDFLEKGYTQALEYAKRNLQFLVVILQSDEHDDTDAFNRETLCSPDLINFLREKNVAVWAGNVVETEAYQVSTILSATTFPFIAIVTMQYPSSSTSNSSSASPKMAVVDQVEGYTTVDALVARLTAAVDRYGPAMNRARMERQRREQERELRQEQDRAYRESLRADQEKERREREKQEALNRAEEEANAAVRAEEELARKKEQYRLYLCSTLPSEPDSTDKDVARLNIKLANGDRVIRKFRGDETLVTLYQFVETYPLLHSSDTPSTSTPAAPPDGYEHRYAFNVITQFPRTVHEPRDDVKIRDVKALWPSATLIIEEDE